MFVEMFLSLPLMLSCLRFCLGEQREVTCEEIENTRLFDSQIIESHSPPNLKGRWLSQECEIRPGPEYILRNYHFMKNNTYVLNQYYYGDESCTLPLYGITARGQIKLNTESWVTPGGTHAEYFMQNVVVIPYSSELSRELAQRINLTCPNYVTSPLKPHQPFTVYSYREEQTSDEQGMTVDILEDLDCLESLYLSFHELQLLRTEERPTTVDTSESELFLGDLPLEVKHRSSYRPTSYQVPLIKWQKLLDCHICHVVAKAQPLAPAHLNAKPKLPVHLTGKWISPRCETRPYGMFLTRRLLFRHDGMWQGYYQYFSDPTCHTQTFSLVIHGRFNLGASTNSNQEGSSFNFTIQRAILIPQSSSVITNLNSHKPGECGNPGNWVLHKAQDITRTGGCVGMGIKVPDAIQDIVKMEMSPHGNPLLYIGRISDDRSSRPTSYELPLKKCHSEKDHDDKFTPYLDADVSVASRLSSSMCLFFIFIFKFFIDG